MGRYPRAQKHPTWQATVQETYDSMEESRDYDHIFGVAARCGYDSVEQMWQENPVIGGSTDPKDFGRIET